MALSPLQVAQAWVAAGGPASAVSDAVAYAYIESGYNPNAVSGTGCVGIWQICPPPPGASDPAVNARAAVGKWRGCRGGSFACDWTPYDLGPANPGWAKGKADGDAAAAALGGQPGSSPSTPAGIHTPPDLGIAKSIKDLVSTITDLWQVLLGAAILAGAAIFAIYQTPEGRRAINGALRTGRDVALAVALR